MQEQQAHLDPTLALIASLEAEQKQESELTITREQELLKILATNKLALINNQDLYKEFMETFFYIRPKGRGIQRFQVNVSQQVLLDAYYIMRSQTPYVRINILKGRQQGMSTMIGACACMEMLLHPSTGAMIATEEKEGSGKNLYRMYELYLQEFQKLMHKFLDEEEWLWDGDITGRFSFGSECYLANDSMFTVVGEKAVTSKTLQFIHLSEAAFYHHLSDCLGMMQQALPKEVGTTSTMFIETTAKMYGNEHHEGWLAACAGRSAFLPLFLPWYIHETYAHPLGSQEDAQEFVESLGVSEDDEFGDEKALLNLDNSNAPWRKLWPGLDFKKYGYDNITLENLKFRRFTIQELNGNILEFNRQYPSTPEMAFLSKSAHVLDMQSIRWYMEKQQREPKMIGTLRKVGYQRSQLLPQRGGIIAAWEEPIPNREYIIGVDTAEGFDSGDFSCAYVISRMPFYVVARLRGSEGRTIGLSELVAQLELLGYLYNTAWICTENNSSGEAVTMGLARESYPHQVREATITRQPSNRFGWRSTQGRGGTRDYGVMLLQETIANRSLGIPCETFLEESHHFLYVNGRAQAARKGMGGVGAHDDAMFAMIGALLANDVLPRPKTEIEMREDAQYQQVRTEAERTRRNTLDYTNPNRFI